MDGPTLFQRIGVLAPDLSERVFFCTGGVFEESTQAFLERVAARVLRKPIDAVELREKLLAFVTPGG